MVHRARVRLGDAVRARVLWRGGEPQCGDLADALGDAHVERFDAAAVRVTTAHAETCELCQERRRLRLDPAALFAAVPIMGAPVLLKQRVAHALAAEGVPMGTAATAPPTPPRRRHRVRRALGLVAAAMVIVVAALVVAAETIDDDPAPRARLDDVRVTTTVAPTTSTTAPPATSPALAPTTEPAVVAPGTSVAPPLTPPPSPTTPAPTVQVIIAVSPSSAPMTYLRPSAPVLTWSTDGPAASVEVSGPGLSSTDPAGSTPVCPTSSAAAWSFCTAPAGSYTYTIVARGPGGEVLATSSATLTIA
jgi:hypothetical protein